MDFTFTYEVDLPNKILICEMTGSMDNVTNVEHMLKNIVKLSGKNQVKNVVLDVTELTIKYSTVDLSNLLMTLLKEDWLDAIRIARIINPKDNTHNLVGEMSKRYNLPIRNFDNRSDAMMWLLFNK